jgi:hypothetical protein
MPDYKSLVELAAAVGNFPEHTVAATLAGILDSVRQLLAAGANPSQVHDTGLTPLFVAAKRGDHPMVRLLLAHGAFVNHRLFATVAHPERSGTALHATCMYVPGCAFMESDQTSCAEILVRAGCDTRALVHIAERSPSPLRLTVAELAKTMKLKPLLKRLEALERKPYVGVVVKLAGLVGGAEHNGKMAFVLRSLPEKKRFELELIESGKRMDVRPANFVLKRLPEGTQVVTTFSFSTTSGTMEQHGGLLGLRHAVRGSVAMPTPYQMLAGAWTLHVEGTHNEGTQQDGTVPTGRIVLDWHGSVPTLRVKSIKLRGTFPTVHLGVTGVYHIEVNASWGSGIQLDRSNRLANEVQVYAIRVTANAKTDETFAESLMHEGRLEIRAGGEQALPPRRNRYGVQGVHLNPVGLFLCTSIPCIWSFLSAYMPS